MFLSLKYKSSLSQIQLKCAELQATVKVSKEEKANTA